MRPLIFSQTPLGMIPVNRLCSSALAVVPISSASFASKTLSTAMADRSSTILRGFPMATAPGRAGRRKGLGDQFGYRMLNRGHAWLLIAVKGFGYRPTLKLEYLFARLFVCGKNRQAEMPDSINGDAVWHIKNGGDSCGDSNLRHTYLRPPITGRLCREEGYGFQFLPTRKTIIRL
ncbi:hypothetical protein LT697_00735 [Pseudomonas syringae pv. syringae]|nr:hypothetical protein [Pseudomonas syringae pv. syringae]